MFYILLETAWGNEKTVQVSEPGFHLALFFLDFLISKKSSISSLPS